MENKLTISITLNHNTPKDRQLDLEQLLSKKAEQLSELGKSGCREIVKRLDGGEPEFETSWSVE